MEMNMGYQGQLTSQQDQSIPQLPLEELKKYFAPRRSPKTGIILLVCGVLLGFGVLCNAPAFAIVGILLIAAGVAVLANLQPRSNITDEQYDRWVEAQFRALIPRSLAKLSLDQSEMTREPLILRSFILSSHANYRPDEVRWKQGKDGRIRYSVNVFTLFWKEDHHLAVYRGDVVALNPQAHTEKTWEYFYADIVGATTNEIQDYITIGKERYQYRFQNFSLRINSGESVDATVSADPIDNKQNLPHFRLPDSGVDETLAQVRSLLREKKQTKM
jgi:hypothetical protein